LGQPRLPLRVRIVVMVIGAVGLGLGFAGLPTGNHRSVPLWDQWAIFIWGVAGLGSLLWYLVRRKRGANPPPP